MGFWGRSRVWGCAGAWEAGKAAPAPNLFCREQLWVSRACWAGEERAEARRQKQQQPKPQHLGTPSGGKQAGEKGCWWTAPSRLGGFAASHGLLPWHRAPWQGDAAQQLLLPSSPTGKRCPHPSWQPGGSLQAKGPHLRGRPGSGSSHGCGLGAGWARLSPRGQHLSVPGPREREQLGAEQLAQGAAVAVGQEGM